MEMSKEKENRKKYVIFKMVQILREYSDREHPMLQKDLVRRLHDMDYTTDRSTVRRALIDLTGDPDSRVHSCANETHEETDSEREYYFSGIYYDQEFTEAELRWLIDGILYSRNAPHAQRDILIGKLCALGNARVRKQMNIRRIRRLSEEEPMNEQLFENIEILNKAIEEEKKVTVVYNYMGPDFALHPVYGDPDYHQLLNPYAMVIRNGFYFLICNKDNYSDMTHYRIDRITDIQLTDLPVKPCRQLDGFHDGWNLQEYMEHNINMAFGEPSLITFIANEKAVPDIIDAFGKGVSFSRRDDGRYDCSVRVPLYDMERWAMQNLNKVLVTSPPELVQRMEVNLRNGLKKYQPRGTVLGG